MYAWFELNKWIIQTIYDFVNLKFLNSKPLFKHYYYYSKPLIKMCVIEYNVNKLNSDSVHSLYESWYVQSTIEQNVTY